MGLAIRSTQIRQADFSRAMQVIERRANAGTRAFHFDFDGVVGLAEEANRKTVLDTLKEYRLGPRSGINGDFAAVCSGPDPKWVLRTLVPQLGQQPEKLAEMVAFMSIKAVENAGLIEKSPIAGMLPGLKGIGKINTIMTNRGKEAIRAAIEGMGIRGALDFVFYVSSRIRPKPEQQMFSAGVEWTGVRKQDAFFIDDNIICVQAARAFGLPSYHLRWEELRLPVQNVPNGTQAF